MVNQNCLFCRIVKGEIPASIVHQDDRSIAFRDVNPQAPVHILVIPRAHIPSLNDVGRAEEAVLGHLMHVAARVANDNGVAESGYRTVINTGPVAGQSVFHIHVHVLGGRTLTWPPG